MFLSLSQAVEELIQILYQPQNIFCIHFDTTADDNFKQGIQNLAACFENIILPERNVDVIYRNWTLVEATRLCLEALIPYDYEYVLNLCEHDFPIKTNLQVGFNFVLHSVLLIRHEKITTKNYL